MAGHARVGRTLRRAACCSSSPARPGIDDWEWGVTLLADDPVALKEIVYEMRFDPVSARYAEFGPFFTGLVLPARRRAAHGSGCAPERPHDEPTSGCSSRSRRSSSTGR